MVKIKCREIRAKSFKEISKQLEDLKMELLNLRVAKVAGGTSSKMCKIRVVRKAIARTYIVFNQKRKETLRMLCERDRFKPLDLRKKKYRAKRKSLSKGESLKRTRKELRKNITHPPRKYALKE